MLTLLRTTKPYNYGSIPVQGKYILLLSVNTYSWAQPALCPVGTRTDFPGVEEVRACSLQLAPSNARVKSEWR